MSEAALDWIVRVHDDPITLRVYVDHVIEKVLGCRGEEAQSFTREAQAEGHFDVRKRTQDEAEEFAELFQSYGLRTTILRGV